jgi:hypothetical protein
VERLAAESGRGQRPVDRDVEVVALAFEVLLQLAPFLVEPGRRLEDARRDPSGESLEGFVVGDPAVAAAGQLDPDDTAVGASDQQLPEGRVDGRVGDVDEAVALRAGEQALHRAVEVGAWRRLLQQLLELLVGERVHANSPLSFCRPS